jgi:hypothetical protein
MSPLAQTYFEDLVDQVGKHCWLCLWGAPVAHAMCVRRPDNTRHTI